HDRGRLRRPAAQQARPPPPPLGPQLTPVAPLHQAHPSTHPPRPPGAFMIVDSFDRIATETIHDHGVSPPGNGVGVREQRRSRVIAMSEKGAEALRGVQRAGRLASLGPGGPHVSPVWFVWDGAALWV